MKRLQLTVLITFSFIMSATVPVQAGDLADILKRKGVITDEEAAEAQGKTLKVLERIDIKGDLRLCHDTQWRTVKDLGEEKEEYTRIRVRF